MLIIPRKTVDVLSEIRWALQSPYELLYRSLLLSALFMRYSLFYQSIFHFLFMFWRDITGILFGLTKDYNIDKFMAVFLDSLLEHRLEMPFLIMYIILPLCFPAALNVFFCFVLIFLFCFLQFYWGSLLFYSIINIRDYTFERPC